MTIEEVVRKIQDSSIKMEEIAEAEALLEDAIEDCRIVLQDSETDVFTFAEYSNNLSLYRKLKNRL